MIVYKIKNKQTGLFATGGLEFKTLGKSWPSIEDVQCHLRHLRTIYTMKELELFYSITEVVVLEIKELNTFNLAVVEAFGRN